MWGLLKIGGRVVKILAPKNDNRKGQAQEISLFDVKALYDAAYAEKDQAHGCLKRFARLLEQAAALESQYRQQEALSEINALRAKAHQKAGAGR